jgi:hypothetical protein
MFGKRVFREGRDHVSSVPLDCLEDPKWDFDLLGYKKGIPLKQCSYKKIPYFDGLLLKA